MVYAPSQPWKCPSSPLPNDQARIVRPDAEPPLVGSDEVGMEVGSQAVETAFPLRFPAFADAEARHEEEPGRFFPRRRFPKSQSLLPDAGSEHHGEQPGIILPARLIRSDSLPVSGEHSSKGGGSGRRGFALFARPFDYLGVNTKVSAVLCHPAKRNHSVWRYDQRPHPSIQTWTLLDGSTVWGWAGWLLDEEDERGKQRESIRAKGQPRRIEGFARLARRFAHGQPATMMRFARGGY
jgi:hypothetical protein